MITEWYTNRGTPYIKHTDNGNEQTDKNGLFNTIRYLSTETATYLIHLNLLKWPLQKIKRSFTTS